MMKFLVSALCLGLLLFLAVPATANRCRLPSDTGPCRGYFRMFYYNSAQARCERFIYGGCGGNANRFRTPEDCEQACAGQQILRDLSPSKNPVCNLPKIVGMCQAYIPSFFYNTQTGKCESFVYGGCQGNANRFGTKPQCERACGVSGLARSGLDPVCQQPKKIGPCRAAFRRWFFNTGSMQCEEFIYGGCRGNQNNFASRAACQFRCRA